MGCGYRMDLIRQGMSILISVSIRNLGLAIRHSAFSIIAGWGI
jgi:hypothetical protein